jgi:hypothetical protein
MDVHTFTRKNILPVLYPVLLSTVVFTFEGRPEISNILKRSSKEATWIEDEVGNLVHCVLMHTSHFALESSGMQLITTYWKHILDGRQGMIT